MSVFLLYALVGVSIFGLGLYGVTVHTLPVRRLLSVNLMGSGVFLVLIAAATRTEEAPADPVPQAMVLTGIVVAVSATGLALALIGRLAALTPRDEAGWTD